MSHKRNCPSCSNEFSKARHYCPHCGRPAFYANVEAAASQEETDALTARYNAAVSAAAARGAAVELADFEKLTASASAVASRWLGDVETWAVSDSNLYPSYYNKLEGGLQEPANDDWNRLRAVMDEILFPGYKNDIRFAALSVTGMAPPGYGDCHITLREDMIGHRVSVFEENSLLWVRDNVQFSGMTIQLPLGYRSGWTDRGRLAVAKLGNRISSRIDRADFPEILLQPGTGPADHQFIELHVWGELTLRTFERVKIEAELPKPSKRKARQSRESILNERLMNARVDAEWIG